MSRTEAKSLKRENLELMLLKKKECTTKALQCVETLIELNVLESTFRQTLPHINQSTYQDVVDERSITYVCGYPLCASQLKDVPKKQYSIVRCNGQLTLFDTVERKKFCSNICYKASKFIHDQLPSSPLWLIETKETDQFTLIPLDSIISRCSYGEEIQMNVERPVTVQDKKSSVKDESDEDKSEPGDLKNSIDKSIEVSKVNDQSGSNNEEEFFDSCSSFDNNQVKLKSGKHEENGSADEDHGKVVKNSGNYLNCDEVSREDTSIGNNPHEQSNGLGTSHSKIEEKLREQGSRTDTINKTESNKVDIQSFDTKVNELEKRNDGKQSPVVGELNVNPKEENKKGKVKSKRKKLDKGKSKDNPDISPVLAAVTNTERKIREWISVESLNFIFGPEKLRNILEEQGLLAKMQEKKIDSARDPYLFERYVEICTRLNILDLKDAKFDKEVKDESTIPSKPLPDFKKLKEEAKAMELKVRSFYAGDKRVQFSEAIMEESESKYEKQNVLPLVDQHAQYAFRRRIVLDHLNKVLPDVLKTVGVANLISKKDIRDLVHTFSLSANNVVFKPIEWQFIAVIIVKLFSVRDEELAKLLAAEKARKYLTLILMSYEQDSEYLDRLMTWLLYEHSLFQA